MTLEANGKNKTGDEYIESLIEREIYFRDRDEDIAHCILELIDGRRVESVSDDSAKTYDERVACSRAKAIEKLWDMEEQDIKEHIVD